MVAAVPYATLSIHSFINKVGADAGFAAIIAVALVVIMLFVHARETASLRERAEDAEDRVADLERAVEQLGRVAAQATQLAQAAQAQSAPSRPGVVAAPAAARTATGARRPAPAPAVAAAAYAGGAATRRSVGPPPQLPAAPFGTAGPALSSATRLIPEPGTASQNGRAGAVAAPDPAPAPAPAPAPTPGPGPSTAAAGGPVAMPSLPRAAEPRSEPPQPGDGGSRAPRRNYGRSSEPRAPRRILPFVVVVVLVAIIAVAAVLVFGHHHGKGKGLAASTRSHSSTTRSTTKGAKRAKRSINPRHVTVAVLNGTTTNNFAANISSKLGQLGFKQGRTANFTNQNQTTTTIGFVPGHRLQALAVAKALKVKYSKVEKVNSSTQQLICSAGAACPDQVFVVLGTDLNSQA